MADDKISVVVFKETDDASKVYCMLEDGSSEMGMVSRGCVPTATVKFGDFFSVNRNFVERLGGSYSDSDNSFSVKTKACLIVDNPEYCAEVECEVYLDSVLHSTQTFHVRRSPVYHPLTADAVKVDGIHFVRVRQSCGVDAMFARFSKKNKGLAPRIAETLKTLFYYINGFVRTCFYERCSLVERDSKVLVSTWRSESAKKNVVLEMAFSQRHWHEPELWISNLFIHEQQVSSTAEASSSSSSSPASNSFAGSRVKELLEFIFLHA